MRRRPSKLDTDVQPSVPEMTRRTASPYAFTKPPKLQRDTSANDRMFPPNTLTPPQAGPGQRPFRNSAGSVPSSPRRDSRMSPFGRNARDYFSGNDSAIENDGETSDSATGLQRGAKTGDGFERPKSSSYTSVQDFAPQSVEAARGKSDHDTRRHTESSNVTPGTPVLRVDKVRKYSPLMAATRLTDEPGKENSTQPAAGSGLESPMMGSRSRDSSYTSSRAVSPASIISRGASSPSQSPRLSAQFARETSAYSPPTSRPQSADSSRPASPLPRVPGDLPRLPRSDQDTASATTSANPRRTARLPSKLASSMRQESMPEVPRANSNNAPPSAPRHASSLPYPEDDRPGSSSAYMPAERGYQYFGRSNPIIEPFGAYDSSNVPLVASPAATTSTSYAFTRPARPSLPTGGSAVKAPSSADRPPPRPAGQRQPSFSTTSQARRDLDALWKKGLPDCPRSIKIAGYDDWYTIIGAPTLDFCPDCVDEVFERTIFRPAIRRSPPRNLDTPVSCAFGSSPWIRLAWLLTLQQQRTDFTLLKYLAEIQATGDDCPGAREEARSWYGITDDEGHFVRHFHVCHSDVQRVERLLPTLSGLFRRLPQSVAHEKHMCAIREDGNRFTTYLDGLLSMHDGASASRKAGEPPLASRLDFIDLVEQETQLPECTRDNLLIGGLWHFIPGVGCTVCEDCYTRIIEPHARKKSAVALRFNRTVQPVYEEGIGSSCQMYSRRMRKVFQRAVEDNDFKYLTRKASERRDAELKLQGRYKDIVRRSKRVSRDDSGFEENERRLNKELERVTGEWAHWE